MNALDSALRAIVADLRSQRVGFALVGGLAVSAWVEPRFTRDADLAISVEDDAQAEQLVANLRTGGYSVLAIVELEAVGRLATVRLERDGAIVDLLFASSGIEPEIVAAAVRTEILKGLTVPVASVGHLIAMKLLSSDRDRRPTDIADLQPLAGLASAEDWVLVSQACRAIEERGFGRGRDLILAATELRTRISPA
ncbi:MAG: nucleotidyl transferase AbiEii/AbiGii toxin family protein [Ilumatobacteraceae bacterium]